MFVPVGDSQAPRRRVPWVVVGLIGACTAAYGIQVWRGVEFTNALALVPQEIRRGVDLSGPVTLEAEAEADADSPDDTPQIFIRHATSPLPVHLSLLTSLFLHASLPHLLGNMLFLWVLGSQLAARMSGARFLTFYLGCGVVAGLGHVANEPDSILPCIGASGAVAAVLGAYVVTFPLDQLTVMAPGFTFHATGRMPAMTFIGTWFVFQALGYWNTTLSGVGGKGGVAFAAHIAGFLSGFFLSIFVVPNAPKPKEEDANRNGPQVRGEREEASGLPVNVQAHIQTVRNEALDRGARSEAEAIEFARRDLVDWLKGKKEWPSDGEMISLFHSQVRKYGVDGLQPPKPD